MVYVLLAEGFEEVEALTPVDLLRRAGVDAKLVGVTGEMVPGTHGIGIQTDLTMDQADWDQAEMIVLPGGMPGTNNLYADKRVTDAVRKCYDEGKYVAAICAAPTILADLGLLKGKRVTCYPAMEKEIQGAVITRAPVTVDGNLITSRGVGTAIDFALELIQILEGRAKAEEIAESIVYE